ncbi:MAG TPA: NAD(P)/FAD-dependent oxidoreductase [Stellaceae bacterium]|nr:NAD(P)/FAD-dependent oxidoreductase [Stellaceae bacterium]
MTVDLLVIGAGPAGMAASIAARRHGLDVVCVDDQPAPGGQIWRAVETVAATARGRILGAAYQEGVAMAAAFRASGAAYLPGTQVWQIEPGFHACVTRAGQATSIAARTVLLATGAQERPAPLPGWTLPGWTLPGVLTVGAAQILLKTSGQVPARPVWIVGCGPLPLLYATQLLQAGGAIAGWLDTAPTGRFAAAFWHGRGAIAAPAALWKGLGWMTTLRRTGVRIIRGVTEVEATGQGRVEHLAWSTSAGSSGGAPADVVLVHEGVVPSIHAPLSLGCEMRWDAAQDCHVPVLNPWGETSRAGVFIAGDGAGIGGAEVAGLRGELAALGVAVQLDRLRADAAHAAARPLRRRLRRALSVRPLLDALYRPRQAVFAPADETIVCRCEELTAGQLRTIAGTAPIGPNQLKAFSRAGMGACQGRQCGATLIRLLAAAQGRTPAEVGLLSVRPPLKPVTLGELATLAQGLPVQ